MNHLFERRVLNFSLRVLLDGEKLIDIWKISRYIKKKVNKIKGNFFVKISTFYIYIYILIRWMYQGTFSEFFSQDVKERFW